ncbi:MAG: hypothetical protein IJ719_14640 [Clostridia bacterium]|nr:hypothetical protein [Clostridia bacterium]
MQVNQGLLIFEANLLSACFLREPWLASWHDSFAGNLWQMPARNSGAKWRAKWEKQTSSVRFDPCPDHGIRAGT